MFSLFLTWAGSEGPETYFSFTKTNSIFTTFHGPVQWGKHTYYRPAQDQLINNELIHELLN